MIKTNKKLKELLYIIGFVISDDNSYIMRYNNINYYIQILNDSCYVFHKGMERSIYEDQYIIIIYLKKEFKGILRKQKIKNILTNEV